MVTTPFSPAGRPSGATVGRGALRALRFLARSAFVKPARYLWTRPRRTKIKAAAVTAFALVLALVPFEKGDAGVVLLPSDGTEVTLPETLLDGKLYKITVVGTYTGTRDGRRYDAEYVTASDPFDTPRSSIVIDDRLATADLKDEANHRYTYYVAGHGRPARLKLLDWIVAGGPEGAYYDNTGFLEVSVAEADFRVNVDEFAPAPAAAAPAALTPAGVPATVFRYTLDPPPRPRDVLRLEIYARTPAGGHDLVLRVDSDAFVDPACGYPPRLSKEARASFAWYGVANAGPYAYKPVPPGLYDASLSVESGDDLYYAFPPDAQSRFLVVAVLPRNADPRWNPQPLIAVDEKGKRLFPYYSPRAAHPILGPISGLEGVWLPGTTVEHPGFLYYSPPGEDNAPVASAGVFYLKRQLNLALATLAECDPTYVYEPMRSISGVFDDELVRKLTELRTRLPYDTYDEERILDAVDNLPPGRGYAAAPAELGRIAGAPTFEHLMNLKFAIAGFPLELPIREFDNYKAYDPQDPYHSLFHTFREVGKRVNGEKRRFALPPTTGAPDPGRRYDISDDDFVALMMCISYQECGFVHTLSDGICYRVGRGRGSATGYMQCTADLIHNNAYKITFPGPNGLVATRMNRLPYNSRYAVRNVARFNIEIGAQFLREVVEQGDSPTFGADFAKAGYGSGCLSWATEKGAINRVKLAGAMYNAGPGAVKVILTEVYDDPATPRVNEGIAYFLDDCDGDLAPFMQRFRDDLYEYSRGRKTFPLQKKPGGKERMQRLCEWLGPFWIKKVEGIGWEEAALMKLDREVIPYIDGVATNFVLFRRHAEYYFQNRDFSGLWQRPLKKNLFEKEIRPARKLKRLNVPK